MSFKELVSKIKQLIKDVQAATTWADRFALIPAIQEILAAIIDGVASLPEPQLAPASMALRNAFTASADKSVGMLLEELTAWCAQFETPEFEDMDDDEVLAMQAARPRPILDALAPLLINLLMKLITG